MASKPPPRRDSGDASPRLAVLIDADNAQASVMEGLLAEIARFGEATVRRIYGDFTSQQSACWKQALQRFAINPRQQFAYTKGKNATDGALIIDAMDLLYTRKFDGFCLVASDSDYTGLANRLREEGLVVYGFGERKTPEAFRNACNKFIFTEVLRRAPGAEAAAPARAADSVGPVAPPAQKPDIPKEFMLAALEQSSDDSGWASLAIFGAYLTKLQPDFDSRLYGFRKLSDLVKKRADLFTTEERQVANGAQKVLYLRAVGER